MEKVLTLDTGTPGVGLREGRPAARATTIGGRGPREYNLAGGAETSGTAGGPARRRVWSVVLWDPNHA